MPKFAKWFKSLMSETEKKMEYTIPFGQKVNHPYYFVKISEQLLELWEYFDNHWQHTGLVETKNDRTSIQPVNTSTLETFIILGGKLINKRTESILLKKECDMYDKINSQLQKDIDEENFDKNTTYEYEQEIQKIEENIAYLNSDIVDTNTFNQISGINIADKNNTQDDNIRQMKNLFVEGTFANDKEKTSTDMFIGVDSDIVQLAKKSNISTNKYADLELPQKFESDLLDTLVTAYFYRKNLSTATSAVWFTVYGDKPELFEYTGKIEPIKKLINNPEYFSRLLMTRRDYYQYLIVTKGAGQNTMTIAFLDDDGVCLGFLALWHNKEKFPVFDENLKKDLTVFSEIA